MTENTARLVFDGVAVAARDFDDGGLRRIDLALQPGELVAVELEKGRWNLPLADAAMGLAVPDEGSVLFDGEDWSCMHPDRAAACRARIGRVFASWGWVSNLTVSENVLLARLNHTKHPPGEIEDRAERLARDLGLSGLPRERSHLVESRDLRRAEWVRALIGEPDLIVLERPALDVPHDLVPPLAGAVARSLDRGASVLWIADGGAFPGLFGAEPCRSYAMRGPELLPLSESVS
jgi:ABC-type lipoprotein export system ATPase subunit